MENQGSPAGSIEQRYLAQLRKVLEEINLFYEISREIGDADTASAMLNCVQHDDIETIRSLMNYGLFKANLYPLLLGADFEEGVKYLVDRYLGHDIDYDRGVTGYTCALQDLFSGIVALQGADSLRRLLESAVIDRKKLRDRRLHEAIFFAIPELDSPAAARRWLRASGENL